MAKLTLLSMVQDILNDMDSDEVNSIDDTIEAQQVAQIIKSSYFEMIDHRNWPHLKKMVQLDASDEVIKPNYLILPERIKELIFFRYKATVGTTTQYSDIIFKHPDDFLRMVSSRTTSNLNIETITDYSGVQLFILNNKEPQYWTSFDDTHIVCDSYNKVVDDVLRKEKTQCMAYMDPLWLMDDDFIPDLPGEAFSALLEEAKSTAFMYVKQMPNQKAEQKATRQHRWLARKAWRTQGGVRYDDYGRKSRK